MNLILIPFFTIILFGCKQNSRHSDTTPVVKQSNINLISVNDIVGHWESKNDSNTNTYSIDFFLRNDGQLEGQYCAVARGGNKIDCSPKVERNVNFLRQEGENIIVSFESFFGAKNGVARIKKKQNELFWEVVKKPQGEFYSPLKTILTKPVYVKQPNSKKIAISSKNYKQQNITMKLYKNIIEVYGCGENIVYGMQLPNYENYEVFIVENNCGDFPFKDLITIDGGNIVGKLSISEFYFDEQENETKKTFNIENYSNIEIFTLAGNIQSTESFYLNSRGKFSKK